MSVFFQANDRELIGSRDVLGQDLPQLPSVAAKVIQHDFAPTAGGYASWTVLTSSTGAAMSIRSGHEHQRLPPGMWIARSTFTGRLRSTSLHNHMEH